MIHYHYGMGSIGKKNYHSGYHAVLDRALALEFIWSRLYRCELELEKFQLFFLSRLALCNP